MKSFHVTYYYLASGMEGNADTADYGVVQANTAQDACRLVADRETNRMAGYMDSSLRSWLLGCLTAKEVTLK